MNTVTYLLSYNFSSLPLEEKCAIKALGRPTPTLNIQQQQNSRDCSVLDINAMKCQKEVDQVINNEQHSREETLHNHCESECDSKSSVEGGYASCDELDDDNDLPVSEFPRPTSLSSNDVGYISSDEEVTNDSGNLNLISKSSNSEHLFHEINIESLEYLEIPESLHMLKEGLDIGLPQDYKVPNNVRPEWLDLDKFKAGQKFALDYLFGLNYSHMLSLLILFSVPEGLEPLVYTDKSSTPFTAYKRYLSTALRVKSWFENDLWSEGNLGFQNLKTVRAMHLSVSNKLNNSSREEIEKDCILEGSSRHPALWCPWNSKLKEYLSSACPITAASKILSDNYSKNRLYFNQGEMSVTQFGFFGLMILYPEKFGAGNATREELESYVHCWRGIGYLLGIKDEYNLCKGSFDEVKQRCQGIIDHIIKPSFGTLSKDWEHMSRCVIEGIGYYVPFINFEASFAYLCWAIGIDAPEFYSSLTWLQYFMFNNMKFFMRFTLRIPGVLGFCNKALNRMLDSQKSISQEKLEILQNKKYSYQTEDNIITRL